MILLGKFDGDVPAVGRRAVSDVHRNVQHSTFDATHQFTLRIWWSLEMEAAHNTVFRHTFIVLHEANRTHFFVELALRETLEKVAASIAEYGRFDDDHTLYAGFDYVHI